MIQVKDITNKLSEFRATGFDKVLSTGSWQLDNHLRLLKGYPWFIGGQPYHGKTEVAMELLMKWSLLYNWRHYVYMGEGGDIHEIVADLCRKLVGKDYVVNSNNPMTESERMYAEMFISEHFYFSDPDQTLTYQGFISEVAKAEDILGFKFDTTVIDPFNDIEYDLGKCSNITYWLKDVLREVRISSKRNNRIDILIVHVAETQPAKDPDTGLMYIPPALPSQWEGGKVWNRRAFVQLNVYRNSRGETEIIVNKAKPKQVKMYPSDKGLRCVWSWDWKRNRYFENAGGEKVEILDPPKPPQERAFKSDWEY